MNFRPLALVKYEEVAINCVAILALQPPLSPQPSLAPPGEKGSSTAVCGRVFKGGEFNVDGQRSKWPLTAVFGNGFEGGEFMAIGQHSK